MKARGDAGRTEVRLQAEACATKEWIGLGPDHWLSVEAKPVREHLRRLCGMEETVEC